MFLSCFLLLRFFQGIWGRGPGETDEETQEEDRHLVPG